MRLHIIRHATVEVPAGTCYGATDVPLVANWQREGERALAQLPGGVRERAPVYSSPLSRCAQLAALFAREVTFDPRLREMDFGEWEQQPWADLPRSVIDAWSQDIANVAPPGGESFAAVSARVLEFLDELLVRHAADDAAEVIIVTHGGPARCLAARTLALPLEHAIRLGFDYGGVACARIHGALHRIEYWNR